MKNTTSTVRDYVCLFMFENISFDYRTFTIYKLIVK